MDEYIIIICDSSAGPACGELVKAARECNARGNFHHFPELPAVITSPAKKAKISHRERE